MARKNRSTVQLNEEGNTKTNLMLIAFSLWVGVAGIIEGAGVNSGLGWGRLLGGLALILACAYCLLKDFLGLRVRVEFKRA